MTEAIKWRGKRGKEPHVNIAIWLDGHPDRTVSLSRVQGRYCAVALQPGGSAGVFYGRAVDPDQTYAIRKAILDLERKR